ncbi:MAG TPA: AAA family ATPase [Thermoanaerobaculia bacterium]|nr:AAA family ATPase [Thermoanaerobaculia bacterium]
MLRLDRLEISGFKSFVDPVATTFSTGITAIVGPNGCGKSNLVEALTWGMGEQSAKFLRSERMEDVIFNGAQGRKPLGMAEVHLHLLADPSVAAAIDGRIEISRRVFRTGESQYRINGKHVSLKEVRDLLMDTGLGLRAYSVIGQGQVESILSGKPQERRRLIEEAAGITKYKARKRVAEMKLEEANANLERLEDVILEVERSVRSLKRQASAARRFRENEAEYNRLLGAVLLRRWDAFEASLAEIRRRLADLRGQEAELAATLHRAEASLASGREATEALAEDVARRHSRRAELLATIEGRQEFARASRQALADAADALARGRQLAERLDSEGAALRESLSLRGAREEELQAEVAEARQAVSRDEEEMTRAREAMRDAESGLETLRAELLVSNAQVTSLQSRLHQEQIENEKRSYRREHNDVELTRLAEQNQAVAQLLAEGEARVAELTASLTAAERAQHEAADALRAMLREEAEVGGQRDALRERLAALRQRAEVLDQLAAADEERRHQLEQALARAGVSEPAFLADRLQVPDGFEHTIDLYLEAFRDAVLVPAESDPLAIARALESEGSRAELLYPLNPVWSDEASRGGAEPALLGDAEPASGAGPSSEHRARISATRGIGVAPPADPAVVGGLGESLQLPPQYAESLPPAFLVSTAEDAERLARLHPGIAFLSRGRLVAEGGLLRVQGADARPGTIARRRERRDIAEAVPELESRLAANGALLETLIGRRTLQAERSREIEKRIAGLRQDLAVASARVEEARQRSTEVESALAGLAAQQHQVMTELEGVAARRERLRVELAERLAAHGALERRFDEAQVALAAARERRELVSTAGAGRRGRLDVLSERLETHVQETARMARQSDDVERRRTEWQGEEQRLVERAAELDTAIGRAETELQVALEERAAGERETIEGEERLRERRLELKTMADQVDRLREQRESLRAAIEEERVGEASVEQDAAHAAETYQERFETPIAEAPPEARVPPGEEPPTSGAPMGSGEDHDLRALEVRLEEAKRVLERLGPVNLLAAQEHDEQDERYRFLTEQRADVVRSVESLRRTIREINQTSSARFQETFAEVNKSFNAVFAELFRGGEAEMRLLDEDDILESGIEIVARPPGKKLQNIMLLSGGEKALTAIALLFALFRTKPTPFCILDEVDAPLDDANVLRFVDLLKSYSAAIQFLIITHNKITMEVASTLYGVTMEERGVSKLVAVDLEEIHPEPQAVSA